MEKKRVIPIWLSVVLVILITTNFGFNVRNLATQDAGIDTAIYLLSVLIDLCAVYYCVMGYSKFGAVFFKLYCWLNIVITAICLFVDAMTFSFCVRDAVLFLLPLFEMMLYFVFAVVPDLGRKKSLTLVSILSTFVVVEMVTWMILTPNIILSCAEGIIITAVFFVMVIAKYADKAARGAK